MTVRITAHPQSATGTRFAVWSGAAERVWLCLFDGAIESRVALDRNGPTLLDVTVDPSAYPAVIDAIRGRHQRVIAE